MTDRRRLIVVRHAKAEPFGAGDHARELTDRGVADAGAVGAHLLGSGLRPDYAVVSTATRTRQTWAALAESAGAQACPVSFDEAVYNSSPDIALEALRSAPGDAATVLFVGHNPTASFLCHLLDDGEGDAEATSGMLQGFPPASSCVLGIDVAWAGLAAETGRVLSFRAGRG